MNASVVRLFNWFLASFLRTHKRLIAELADARATVMRVERQLEEGQRTLDRLEQEYDTLRGRDGRALPLTLLHHGILAGVLSASEGLVNYLAAQGLFLGQRLTLGVTAALTFVAGLLAYCLAHELRSDRRSERAGEVETSSGRLLGFGLSALAFLGLTLYLRLKYFEATTAIDPIVLGGVALSPWAVALSLTLLSGIFIGSAAYVLSHADLELARAKAALAEANGRVFRLTKVLRAAKDRTARAFSAMGYAVSVADSELTEQIAAAGLLPRDEDEQNRLLVDLRRRLWMAATSLRGIAPPDEPDAPAATSTSPAADSPSSRGGSNGADLDLPKDADASTGR